jgi:hypothetical protein
MWSCTVKESAHFQGLEMECPISYQKGVFLSYRAGMALAVYVNPLIRKALSACLCGEPVLWVRSALTRRRKAIPGADYTI